MSITLSQSDYWSIFRDAEQHTDLEKQRIAHNFPKQLGHGYYQEFDLRGDIELAIADYCLHDDLTLQLPEREHCLEYSFFLLEERGDRHNSHRAGEYVLYGSGTAPQERYSLPGHRHIRSVDIHITAEQLCSFIATPDGSLPNSLSHLVRSANDPYYIRSGTITPAMNGVLQQLWACSYQGIMQRLYLESKIWELTALLIEQEITLQDGALAKLAEGIVYPALKSEDVERIYQAREILRAHLDQPPSLLELARQVGLNDYALKRGFRQVFKTTAFGCLHQLRMERARQLLTETDMTIADVSYAVGFANRGYFAASFRKQFGLNPKSYAMSQKNSA